MALKQNPLNTFRNNSSSDFLQAMPVNLNKRQQRLLAQTKKPTSACSSLTRPPCCPSTTMCSSIPKAKPVFIVE